MTLDQFLEKLKQTPRKWRVVDNAPGAGLGAIRLPNGTCPIMHVAGLRGWEHATSVALNVLGLQMRTADKLMSAADSDMCSSQLQLQLRKRLMKACGLV